MVDGAGNESVSSVLVRLDFTSPALVPDTAQLVLQPPPGCPVNTVSRWTRGATARVAFVLDEPVATLPVVRTSTPETITFEHRSGLVTSFAFEKTLGDEALYQGLHDLQAEVVDQVGNRAMLGLDCSLPLVVDTMPPTLLVDQSAVRYVRSPWGNAAAEDLGGLAIPAGPYYELAPVDNLAPQSALAASTFELVDEELILLQVWADAARGSLLGSTAANGDGTWPRLRLANLDTPSAFVDGFDGACNSSELVKIENAEWVATPNPPAFAASPHLLQASLQVADSLEQDPLVIRSGGTETFGFDGAAQLVRAQPRWRERGARANVTARAYHAVAYDNKRGRTVLFGGMNAEAMGLLRDTWEWDGQDWIERTPAANNPPVRIAHAMAYDSTRECVVLFGGYHNFPEDFDEELQDTWEWDGQSWIERTPFEDNPPARGQHAMVYDSQRQRVVLFGGQDSRGAIFQDTWEWDGEVWTERTPDSDNPPERYEAALAFDSARVRVVLFGGRNSAGPMQDTWEWDGQVWAEVIPVSDIPAKRSGHVAVFDSARARVVLFGGQVDYYDYLLDAWEWDGQAWVEQTPGDANPPPRTGTAAAFDVARSRVVLVAGVDPSWQSVADTWEWDGQDWVELTPDNEGPVPRSETAMAYDSSRGRIVLFGGRSDSQRLNDTWEWDGRAWSEVEPASGAPVARYGHAMAYDSARGRVVLLGGYSSLGTMNDLWEWDGQDWLVRTPASGSPPDFWRHAMAYDSARGRLVVFGGNHSGQETWEWDGQSWLQRIPATASPPAREYHAMAYDAARGRVVLFGGKSSSVSLLQDTWEWDGDDWSEVTSASNTPSPRWSPTLAFYGARGHVVMFGGYCGGYDYVNDVWEWDGQDWTQRIPVAEIPAGRWRHAMAYDIARDRIVVFGGRDTMGGACPETWEYDGGAAHRPAFQFDVAAAVAGFSAAELTGLRVRAHCGGTFAPFDANDVGATLLGWSIGGLGLPPGSWRELASNSAFASTAEPHLPAPPGALIDWSAASADEAKAYLFEHDRSLHFQCRPSGLSGTDDARVALDYIEVRVRYRAP
ncbi:MAG: hypothetical protein JXR83_12235 [Deltaproteobacteria bacterium]|nr:hypothetical protein [Deltaproteobacteria bacterium]